MTYTIGMTLRQSTRHPLRPGLAFILLCIFTAILFVAGGASRGDAMGQVIVRVTAWMLLIGMILFDQRPALRPVAPVVLLLGAALLLVLTQLIPLPPAFWQTLPGRSILADAIAVSGDPQPWRPWSMTPGATRNAAASLVVPVITLLLVASLGPADRARLPGLLLALATIAALVGLLQFSGAGFNNPFVNDSVGQVSGNFANRNHFALFLAIGCLLAPFWAFAGIAERGRQGVTWRGPAALGLVLLFVLMILASGSRAGLMLGMIAIVAGLLIARGGLRRALAGQPRWLLPVLLAVIVATVAVFVLVSVVAGRAEAIDRILQLDTGQDMRRRALPTVLAMIGHYFPAGSGLGGFDPIFRIHEPFALLKMTYFNHAHNDFLEIVLDAGAAGAVVLVAALGWWLMASVSVWRPRGQDGASRDDLPLRRLGSAMVLLILVASGFDYPARTPMMMTIVTIAGCWLAAGLGRGRAALPMSGQHL